jgi:hypothetical protein
VVADARDAGQEHELDGLVEVVELFFSLLAVHGVGDDVPLFAV